MRFTAQEEYGLRCMLQFARGQVGRSLTISEIAKIEGLTPEYAGKLVRLLRMGGLLESVRGRHGGYRLARPVDQVSIGEVLAVLGGRVFEADYCSRYTGDRKLCVHSVDCAIRSLWKALQAAVDNVLSRVKLRDLMGGEEAVAAGIVNLTGMLDAVSLPPSVSFPSVPLPSAPLKTVAVKAGKGVDSDSVETGSSRP